MEPVIQSLLAEATIPHTIPVIEKKASSTSSLYIGSAITTPSIKSILRVVASFLAPHISSDLSVVTFMMNDPDLCHFCEQKYIIENPESMESADQQDFSPPTKQSIAEFIGALYDCAQFRFIFAIKI